MNKNKQIQNHWMYFKVSTLAASVTSLILASLPAQIQASDIDIYQAGGTGATRIYLMLDTSGSMAQNSSFNVDYGYTYYKWGQTYNLCERVKLPNNLQVKIPNKDNTASTSYTYATSSDYYCSIDLDSSAIQNTNEGKAYREKIQSVCEKVGATNTYNCYSRIVNLRKGLISVVADASIDEKIYFALGNYPNSNQGGKTVMGFTSMDASGKKSLIEKIQALSASSNTPISPAYNVAGNAIIQEGQNATGASASCTGNGVYFLTDGEPSTNEGQGNFSTTLSNNKIPSLATKDLKTLSTNTWANSNSAYWTNIGNFSQNIRASKYLIKTATVGFGGGYYLTQTQKNSANITIGDKKYFDCSYIDAASSGQTDHQSLCRWGAKSIPNRTDMGGFGEGGFYTAQSSADLVESIKTFITDTTVPIEGTTIGSSTIPNDALNTNQLQPFAYFPMFKPLIETADQLWVGNLKKFNVLEGTLYDTNRQLVFKNSTDINTGLNDYWLNKSVTHADEGVSYGGNLSQLLGAKMPKTDGSNNLVLQRKVFINDGSSASDLKSAEDILKAGTLADREYLYGLLGYSKLTAADLTDLKSKSYTNQLTYLKTKTTAQGYQLGSIIHSSPILLTQKGAIAADAGTMGSVDRDDYVLFGTTQGVLHVVKSGTQNSQVINGSGIASGSGEEVFSFVPKEMLVNQKKGFFESMAMEKATNNNNAFYYGVDGPWTAHTVYEPNFYNATVNGTTVERDGLQVKADSKLSHQYVYGGLRMGGRSYYALNLSDIDKPKLMFHINPDAETSGAISYMGQSWSKPTVAYIKWNGQRKLAMIVGGGYDMEYEDPTFTSSSLKPVKGNGVYIFDAENGKLLWWGSSRAGNVNGDKDGGAATAITDMTNSIPSRIKTADRDGDGLVDHLYVGDLGGKVFRIDLNPNHKASDSSKKFVLNAFTFADAKDGNNNPPRFYEAPTFTMHTDSTGKRFAVVSLASGDRSSPLKSESSAQDMILGFYDSGVTQVTPVKGTTVNLSNMNEIYGAATNKTGGWYYRLPKTDSKYQTRGLSEGVALDKDLYYSVFDPSKTNNGSSGTSTSCSGGIVGTSKAYKLCLPSGVCGTDTKITEVGDLGAGIISLNVGPGTEKGSRKLIFNKIPETCVGTSCTPNPIVEYNTTNKLLPTRWYNMTPYVGAK
ncbi:pilus assembly protein [Acinetobacter sp. WCHAc060025]|uniref:pilus assembly protein n=1 Tax=Acinetobacter sp. WCHAc060025 TaxID=2518625 RepID=UPI001023028F|nr:PilC/PilY family type IV pilus protein [Acinetobacter sp. WCHAc060025]RZG74360.1 hypothetical protein EXE09_13350 [Acinetobacter sp. WCHAc060025]